MKASELRIGNNVYLKLPLIQGTVTKIIATDLMMLEQGKDHLLPIPITPEWLERLGFSKLWHLSHFEYILSQTEPQFDIEAKPGYLGNKEMFIVNLVVDGEQYSETPQSVNYIYFNHIKHVHQLQNLYFALTGEELQLTTEKQATD